MSDDKPPSPPAARPPAQPRKKDQFANLAAIAGVHIGDDYAPTILLERDLNRVARRLGEVISRLDLYQMNGDYQYFDFEGKMQIMTGRKFCSWINDHVVMAEKFDKDDGSAIPGMLGIDAASIILDNENFRRGVRKLDCVNHVRCPVIRADGSLALLPWGYDEEFRTYTIPGGIEYRTDLAWESAKARLRTEFGEFPLVDDRSWAVQIAAVLALYVRHLPGGSGLRPGFLWYANKPGSGKSVLAKACLYPVLGRAAAAKMKRNEDLDKELEAFCRANVPYIFLDNIYGGIQSASIDQMLTSEESTGRSMGGHGVFVAKNSALLLATGNQVELNDDALRRFLLVDLFETGNPEERKITKPLNDETMKSDDWRRTILECCYALVAHWHESGMPRATRTLNSFEGFSYLLGGIVEAAGYHPPFVKAELPDAKTPGAAEFTELMRLVKHDMALETSKDYTYEDLARLARAGDLYNKAIGTAEEGKQLAIKLDNLGKEEKAFATDQGYMTSNQRAAFSKKIVKEIGSEPIVDGVRMRFGRRAQSRKASFTIEILGPAETTPSV